jgi:hypothetical protein
VEAPGLPAIPPSPKQVPVGQLEVHAPWQQSPSSSCAFWAPAGLAAVHESTHELEQTADALSAGHTHDTWLGLRQVPKQSAQFVGSMQTSPAGHVMPTKPPHWVVGPQ